MRFLVALCVIALGACERGAAEAEPPEVVPAELPPPGPGPGPPCDLPPVRCPPDRADCNDLVLFTPAKGVGYEDVPFDGETPTNQYASYLRRDVMMVIQYAAAKVACKAAGWAGSRAPVALGDMSERDGAIPGTALGFPGHPPGTHTGGFDIDLAYFQQGRAENTIRPVCYHIVDGVDQHHCLTPPHWLDPWRTALFLGALYEHPRIRVVGVDGAIGPVLEDAIARLCRDGWIERAACERVRLAYETTPMGRGWFTHHFSHFHVSFIRSLIIDEGDVTIGSGRL